MTERREGCYEIPSLIMPPFLTDRRRYFKTHKTIHHRKLPLFHRPKKVSNLTYAVMSNGKKVRVGASNAEKEWLDKLKVPERQKVMIIRGKFFSLDGFNPATRTAFEYNGDAYHGSHKVYPKNRNVLTWLGKTPNELYIKTIERYDLLNSIGIKVFFVWDSEYKKGTSTGRYYRGHGDNLY